MDKKDKQLKAIRFASIAINEVAEGKVYMARSTLSLALGVITDIIKQEERREYENDIMVGDEKSEE